MKAIELMIGDWYYDGFSNKYRKVTPYFLSILEGDIGEQEYSSRIILDEEILNANQWFNNGYDDYIYKGDSLKTNLWLVEKVLNKSNIIESVHEFQHLLRLCKRDDMADNFKLPQP